MAKEWFVRLMGSELGPMEAAELKRMAGQGQVSRDDVVRRGTSGQWVAAETVRGLFDGPPPNQPATPTPAPAAVQPPSTPRPNPDTDKPKWSLKHKVGIGVGVWIVLALIVQGFKGDSAEERARKQSEADQKAAVKRADADREAADDADRDAKAAFEQSERDRKRAEASAEASARKAHGDKYTAYAMAQNFVKDKLRYPKGKFPWTPTEAKDMGGNVWFVRSYVDTTNGFGADVRLNFSANVKCLGDDQWTLDTLDVWENGQPIQTIK